MSSGLILQHGSAGPPGVLGEWLGQRGIDHEIVNVWESPPLPDPSRHAFVVSLGSQHSVRDTEPAWIPRELELLRAAVRSEVPVLGLCFGGQALSTVLGGGVDKLARAHVGWAPVHSDVEWLAPGPWLQYHKEVLRVPDGAQRIAHDASGPAAFVAGPHLGTQFHPEVTAEILDGWARLDPELDGAGTTPDELAQQSRRYAAAAREAAFRLFDAWWARVTAPAAVRR